MKKILLSFIIFISIISSSFALDVCGKVYVSQINGVPYEISFMCGPFSPGVSGKSYIVLNNNIIGIYDFQQNIGDPIVNLGDFGVFYQSPSDVLTFIPPPFVVFYIKH